MIVSLVVIWTNGMVGVFDEFGEQVTELQGRFGVRAPAISAVLRPETEIYMARWRGERIRVVDRESFDRLWKQESQ